MGASGASGCYLYAAPAAGLPASPLLLFFSTLTQTRQLICSPIIAIGFMLVIKLVDNLTWNTGLKLPVSLDCPLACPQIVVCLSQVLTQRLSIWLVSDVRHAHRNPTPSYTSEFFLFLTRCRFSATQLKKISSLSHISTEYTALNLILISCVLF